MWYFWLKYTKLRIRSGEQGEFIWTIKTQTVHKIVSGFAIVHLGYVLGCVGVPYHTEVFKDWADEGFVCARLYCSWRLALVALEEGSSSIGLLGCGIQLMCGDQD